jgi:predicted transcriptional regulator
MKITKTQLKRIIKEELESALGESQWQDNIDSWEEERGIGRSAPEEEVTHEEVIEKVQELPQGALAKIWELLKTIEQGGTKLQKWINTVDPKTQAHWEKTGFDPTDISYDPTMRESRKKKTKK